MKTIEEKRKQWNEYYEAHKDERKASFKKYYEKNKEAINKHNYEYRMNNPHIKEVRAKNQREYNQKYPEKLKARGIAYRNITINNICLICKVNPAEQMHHEDYSKPLEIIPVCIKCHTQLHKEGGNI